MDGLAWLGVIRHGESEGNVAAQRAEASGAEIVDIDLADAEVPLTATGREQAAAVGRWLGTLPPGERPGIVVSSPYRRALETAEIAVASAPDPYPLLVDERLRDRELGVLDRLTRRGVTARMPEEAQRRRRLGRVYYRPPGGESWADVALRLRAALGDLRRDHADRRVLIVAHEAVAYVLRYLVEGLTVAQLAELAGASGLDNGSLTAWVRSDGALKLVCCNDVSHLVGQGAPVTRQEVV
jgi:2,3-bisphosphoglycerate-dependent phosphoglycerate mutase